MGVKVSTNMEGQDEGGAPAAGAPGGLAESLAAVPRTASAPPLSSSGFLGGAPAGGVAGGHPPGPPDVVRRMWLLVNALQSLQGTQFGMAQCWRMTERGRVGLEAAAPRLSTLGMPYVVCEPRLAGFRTASCGYVFAPDQGLPGRVWKSLNVEVAQTIANYGEEKYLRKPLCKSYGVLSTIGVPIFDLLAPAPVLGGSPPAAVLEFFFVAGARGGVFDTLNVLPTVLRPLGLSMTAPTAEDRAAAQEHADHAAAMAQFPPAPQKPPPTPPPERVGTPTQVLAAAGVWGSAGDTGGGEGAGSGRNSMDGGSRDRLNWFAVAAGGERPSSASGSSECSEGSVKGGRPLAAGPGAVVGSGVLQCLQGAKLAHEHQQQHNIIAPSAVRPARAMKRTASKGALLPEEAGHLNATAVSWAS